MPHVAQGRAAAYTMGTFVVDGAFLSSIKYIEAHTRLDRKNLHGVVCLRAWQVREPTGVRREPPTPMLIRVISFGVYLTFSISGSGFTGNARDVLTRSIEAMRAYVDEKIHQKHGQTARERLFETEMYVSGVEVHDRLLVVKVKRASDAESAVKFVRNFYSYKHHPSMQLSYDKKKPAEWQKLAVIDSGVAAELTPYCAVTDIDAVEQFLAQSKLVYSSHIVLSPTHIVPGDQPNELYAHMHHLRIVDVLHQRSVKLFQIHTPDIPEHMVHESASVTRETDSEQAARLERHIAAYTSCVKWAIDKGPSHHPAHSYKHLAPHDPTLFYYGVPPWYSDGSLNIAGVPPRAADAERGAVLRAGGMLM